MTFVHKLSLEGMTVCATIHSPSPFTFHLFERLLLMAGGRIAYFGQNGDMCVDYLFTSGLMPEGSTRPERYQQAEWIVSFITDAVNHGRRDEMADCFMKSSFNKSMVSSMVNMRSSYTQQSKAPDSTRPHSAPFQIYIYFPHIYTHSSSYA